MDIAMTCGRLLVLLMTAASAIAAAQPAAPAEPLRIEAAATLHFREIATLPAGRPLARAATLDRVAALYDHRGMVAAMTVTTVADGASTTVALPDALQVESIGGAVDLRVDGHDVEVVAVGFALHPGGLARWSAAGGWSAVVPFPADARRALPTDIAIARTADHWLVVPRGGIDHYAWWSIDATGVQRIPAPLGPGASASATQEFGGVLRFATGTLVFVGDSSTTDGKAAGYPGRTRAAIVTGTRVTELGAPFPLMALSAVRRLTAGRAAAFVAWDPNALARVFVVDGGGVLELALPDGVPLSLHDLDGAVIGWGAERLTGDTTADAQPVRVADLSGWVVDPRAQPARLRAFATPRHAPPGWTTFVRARIGDELCTWAGISMSWDDAAHRTLVDIITAQRPVQGGACVDPKTATVRLLAADPPPGDCRVLADGAQALVACDEPGRSRLWLVTI